MTAIKRRIRSMKKTMIDPAEIYFVQHGTSEGGPPCEHLKFKFFMRRTGGWQPVWEEVREKIMSVWTKKNPCTRPWAWWRFDAPKEPVAGWDYEHFNSPQRKRLGGTGTPTHEHLGSRPGFIQGIPGSWIEQWSVDYYNGRAKDIHGNPIGQEYKPGDFKGIAIDPNDPPTFESVAAYLERLDLLTASEKKWLDGHPEAMKPERIELDEREE